MGEEKGRAMGMPVKQFTAEAYAELVSGNENVVIGALGPAHAGTEMGQKFLAVIEKRKEIFMWLANLMKSH